MQRAASGRSRAAKSALGRRLLFGLAMLENKCTLLEGERKIAKTADS